MVAQRQCRPLASGCGRRGNYGRSSTSLFCPSQANGSPSSRSSSCSFPGCRPSRIASTISGASTPYREGRQRSQRRTCGSIGRLLRRGEARFRPEPGLRQLDPVDEPPERFPPRSRSRRIEPVGQPGDAARNLAEAAGAGGAWLNASLRKPGSRRRAARVRATAASISAAGMRQPVAPVATLLSTRSALT